MAIARIGISSVVHDAVWGSYNTLNTNPTAATLSVTSGDFVLCRVLGVRLAGGCSVTFIHVPTDSQGNTWVAAKTVPASVNDEHFIGEYYTYATATGTLSVNIRSQYDVDDTSFTIANYSGVASSSPVNNVGAGVDTSVDTTVVTSEPLSATMSQSGDLLSVGLSFHPNANNSYTASGSPTPVNVLTIDGNGTGATAQGRLEEASATGLGSQTITIGYAQLGTTPCVGYAVAYKAAPTANTQILVYPKRTWVNEEIIFV